MIQTPAGVDSLQLDEAAVMTVWPSISAYRIGRFLGRLYAIRWPDVYIFRFGSLVALLSVATLLPTALYFFRLLPRVGLRYCLTNCRILVRRGISATEAGSIDLDAFDSIEIDVQAGQAWFQAGDLLFKQAGETVLRLAGVSRPESFRQTCLKSRMSYVGVRQALQQEAEQRSA